jgi:hypothetical protein
MFEIVQILDILVISKYSKASMAATKEMWESLLKSN